MTVNLSNSLAGLTLLSGSNAYSSLGTTGVAGANADSVAVRKAKAAFTLPTTTPPWSLKPGSDSSQLATIKAMQTIIDKAASGPDALPGDVQTSFTAYKALDRLRVLAETAAKSTTGSAERGTLDTVFAKGLSDLRTYLANAPSDKLDLAYGVPTRRAESVGTITASPLSVAGEGVVATRDAPLPGLTGTEQFTITMRRFNVTDQVSIDLSQGAQPPTLDSIAEQINAAIAAIPLRNPDGSVVTDSNGNPQPRWLVRFVPDKHTDKWGFTLKNPASEDVSIDQTNGKDALVVASGRTPLEAPTSVRLMRIDDPGGAAAPVTLGEISAYDRTGTARAKLLADQDKTRAPKGVTLSTPHVAAATSAAAIATASDGASYVVGTAAGELGANRPAGTQDLYLTKMDSEGRVLWQRMLGAAKDATGAAVSIGADGGILVAGTVTGGLDGVSSDGDMLVARFDASGTESFSTLVRSIGMDSARAITSDASGNIYVGGAAAVNAGGTGGNAMIAKLDASGTLTGRRIIDSGGSDSIAALALAPDGALLSLGNESGSAVLRRIDTADLSADLGSVSLGAAEARALAVASDGGIAVGGATSGALAGAQVNGLSGARDGFVSRISADLSTVATSYVGTSGTDQVDSVAFLGDRIYAGGRTTGTIGAEKRGPTDGFVVSLDGATGAQLSATQFGQSAQQTEAVRIAAAPGGATALGALGLARGVLTPQNSNRLVAQTSLRAGDSFSVRAQGGKAQRITITADDTMASLAARVTKALGSARAAVTTPTVNGAQLLRIEAKNGSDVELTAGPDGRDALEKLGLAPTHLSVPAIRGKKDPVVTPGGNYGLALTDGINLSTAKDAAIAAARIRDAISTTQTAYRSLYWDSAKAARVNGAVGGSVSAYQSAQVARYQDALTRISALTGVTSG